MAWKRTVEHTMLGGVGPLVKHLAGSTAGTVALRCGSNGCEDAVASMVGDITRGTIVNQSFSDIHCTSSASRDYRIVVASNGQHLLDGLTMGRR
jgi:hypothetical protein